MVQVLVLGPIGVTRPEGRPLRLGSPLMQRLIGVLATEAGRPIGRDRLIEVLWGDSPPDGATNNLHVYVSRLRNELGREAIETSSLGYTLSASVELDSAAFERCLDHARSADLAEALASYDEALALWRGPVFGAFSDEWWARLSASRLAELRLAAMGERIDVLLALGDVGRAVADSELLLAADPLKEPSVLRRMRALHTAGRSADALRVAAAFRRRLSDQVGLSASPALDELEQQILDHDPAATRAALTHTLRGYVFGELLAEGAHGAVYAANQPSLGREVAIKVLRKDRADAPEFIRRFEAEAQFVARLEHPSIVPLYDYWREPGNAYLVLRLLRGGSLAQRIARRELIPIDEIDLLVERIGDALSSAHGRGVVHRDVRAANVLYDDEGRPYLSDFGIAVAEGSVDDAADDVAALAAMLLPLVGEDSALAEQRSLLRRAATGEIVTARELVMTWRASRELVTPTPTPERAHARRNGAAAANPYVGLRTFDEADAALFFGRDAAVAEIVELAGRRPFVTVVGPSGAGKSSVVRAGVIPQLRAQGCVVTTMAPGTRPLYSLGVALRRVATEAQLASAGDDAARLLNEVAVAQPTVVVIDQLEELWTQSVPDDRVHLIKVLDEAISNARLRVISTIRADFYDRPLDEPLLAPLVQKGNYSLTALGAAELEASISGPLAPTGVSVEAGLVAQIVVDVTGRPAPLPLVQYALSSLYDRRAGNVLTLDAYQSIGGVAGAIASAAEELYQQLAPTQQEQCRELFANLVTPGESSSDDTRRRALRSELPDIDVELIERLNQLRLLTFDRDAVTGEPTVEIAHEALLTHWPRLRQWTDDQRDQLRTRRALRDDAAGWDHQSRSAGYLYRAGRLDTALDHVGTIRLTPLERAFLDASVDQRDRETSRERRRLRRAQGLLATTAALLVIALVAGALALTQRNRADERANEATAARDDASAKAVEAQAARDNADVDRMIAQARADAPTAPVRATLLAAEAYRRRPDWQTAGAIQSVLTQQPQGVLSYLGDAVYKAAAYGDRLIAARDLTKITLWDATTFAQLRVIELGKGDGAFNLMRMSADERYVAATLPDAIVVFDAGTGERLASLALGKLLRFEFDPADSSLMGVVNAAGLVTLVRWKTTDSLFRREGEAPGTDVSFTPDGRTMITAHKDGTLHFWDARTGTALIKPARAAPAESDPWVFLTPASPDGTMVASVSITGQAGVWRVADGAQLAAFAVTTAPVPLGGVFLDDRTLLVQNAGFPTRFDIVTTTQFPPSNLNEEGGVFAALNPKRNALITAANYGGMIVHALDGRIAGARLSVPNPPGFRPIPDYPSRISVNDRGTQLLAFDQRAYLYDLTNPNAGWRAADLPGDGALIFAKFTDDGRSILTLHQRADDQVSFQLRDGASLQPTHAAILLPRPSKLDGFAIALSPDQRRVAWAYNTFPETRQIKPRVRIYDIATGATEHSIDYFLTLGDSDAYIPVWMLSFNADATRLAAAMSISGENGGVFIFDLADSAAPPARPDNEANTVTFDPTGRYMVLGHLSTGEVSFLDAKTLAPLSPARKGRATTRATVDPSGSIVLTDNTCYPVDDARGGRDFSLWDASSFKEIGAGFAMTCGFWFPDGSAFGGNDATHIRIYDFKQESWLDAACRFAGRDLTESEWELYGPKQAYRKTCSER